MTIGRWVLMAVGATFLVWAAIDLFWTRTAVRFYAWVSDRYGPEFWIFDADPSSARIGGVLKLIFGGLILWVGLR
jgi:hypothetical protein